MGKKFMRFIDSAQRRVVVAQPESPRSPGVSRVVFQIQGVEITVGSQTQVVFYHDMADRGVRKGKAEALSMWQRLRRQPALIGQMRLLSEDRCELELWDDGFTALIFDLDRDAAMLRECEIMLLSAGYHWHLEDALAASE